MEESGSYRIRFPNTDGLESEAVIVNTAGGVAGGDDFGVSIAANGQCTDRGDDRCGGKRSIAAIDAPARMNVSLSVASGAALRWLPQETILFDQTRLHRDITVDLDDTASAADGRGGCVRPHGHERDRPAAANWSTAGAFAATAGWSSPKR